MKVCNKKKYFVFGLLRRLLLIIVFMMIAFNSSGLLVNAFTGGAVISDENEKRALLNATNCRIVNDVRLDI